MGAPEHKLWLPLGGEPILIRTLRRLAHCQAIAGIVVVIHPGDREKLGELEERYELPNIAGIVDGGETRQESVARGFRAIAGRPDLVLIHDGARPLVNTGQVDAVIRAAARHGAAILALPIHDTVIRIEAGVARETVSREDLWAAQTPQVFRYGLFEEALQRAEADGFVGTDEASLVERLGRDVHVVEGSPRNLKITTPDDLAMAEGILNASRPEMVADPL
jgi:2-C-methyl-D-erythritol 4-phosphate cytidylyltransferase